MNDNIQKCTTCGSSRVVSGKLNGVEGPVCFEFSELDRGRYWTTFSEIPQAVSIRQDGSARVCLDCGKVSTSLTALTVDVEEAKRVLDKWGTDALKSRLAIGPPAP